MNRTLFYIVFFILLIGIVLNSFASNCLTEGDYLSITFMERIKNGMKPIDAESGLNFVYGKVRYIKDEVRIDIGGYFDGVSLFISKDCKTALNTKKYPLVETFKSFDNVKFSIESDGKRIAFQYIDKNHEHWISTTIFMGKWLDQNGNNIVFGNNGAVNFNGKEQKYNIERTIPSETDGLYVDILVIGDNKWAFDIKNEKTYLYSFDDGNLNKDPEYILTKGH